jgi:hypothetical protein
VPAQTRTAYALGVSSTNPPGSLHFSEPRLRAGYYSCVATLTAEGRCSRARLEMIAVNRTRMVSFFEELAAEADGWVGSRCWESEFGELAVTARSGAGGRVILRVAVRLVDGLGETVAELAVPPHELRRLADGMPTFLRLPSLKRFPRYP